MISRATLLVVFAAAGLAACTQATNNTAAELENRVEIIEPELVQAGFKLVALDTPQKQESVAALRPLHFNRLGRHQTIYYYFPDPQYCKCVYIGDALAYQTYKQIHSQNNELQQSAIDAQLNAEVPAPSPWNPEGSLTFP